MWYGVCLTPPDLGKNDGTVLGKHYFDCDNMQGLFTEPHNVRMDDGTMSASSAVQAIDKIGSNVPAAGSNNAVVVGSRTGPSGGSAEGGSGENTANDASGSTDGQEEAVGYASTDNALPKNDPMIDPLIATSPSSEQQQRQDPTVPAPPRRPSQIGTGVTNAAAYLNALDKKIDVLVNQDDAEEVASHRELDVDPVLNTAAGNDAVLDNDKVQLDHEDTKMITKMDAVADNVQEQQQQQQPPALPGLYAAQEREPQRQPPPPQQPEGYPQQQNVFQRL